MSSTSNSHQPYREVTVTSLVTGIVIGCVMTATFAYAGMVMGFSLGGSTVAALLGWAVLRLVVRRGTILENNIIQTVASGINATSAGVIFTIPVLFLLGERFNPWSVGLACMAGAVLGVGFIIPLRRQMIDIERLVFPSGIAVATILKSPGEGVKKSVVLFGGAAIGAVVIFLQQTHTLHLTAGPLIPETADLGKLLHWPPYVQNVWGISLLALGIGFITGRNGLFILAGGVLSYWLITPVAVNLGWGPAAGGFDPKTVADAIHGSITRPLGIGMLVGGAVTGVILTFPALRESIKGLRSVRGKKGKSSPSASESVEVPEPEEMPVEILYGAIWLALGVLFLAAHLGGLEWGRAFVVAILGSVWLWLAGIIVAQATGMTDWSPISGMALLAVVVLLYLTAGAVVAAVMIGAAVCVAVSECADMMQDLRTGHLVGSRPRMQQLVEIAVAPLGPMIAIGVVSLLWTSGGTDPSTGQMQPGFGPGTAIPVPQAAALQSVIEAVQTGSIDWFRYGSGAAVGALLSLSGVPGLGVLVGISMYLGLSLILPYSLGAVLRAVLQAAGRESFCREWGIPAAVGFVVGDALMTLFLALLVVTGAL